MISDTPEEGSMLPKPELDELMARLAATIEEAEGLLHELEGPADEELTAVARGLERRLSAAEQDRRELALRLVETERRAERLMTLYVATFHLHARQEPEGVESAIAEIAVDLLGARRFVLLLKERGFFRVTLTRPPGVEPGEIDPVFAGGVYRGGAPLVDAALRTGALQLAGDEEVDSRRKVLAAVPLNMEQETSGLLVILDLFEQKHGLTFEDRDVLDLLAAHAASALLAAQLFHVKDRKLKSFQSLLELARPGLPRNE